MRGTVPFVDEIVETKTIETMNSMHAVLGYGDIPVGTIPRFATKARGPPIPTSGRVQTHGKF
jgi:hypothetical protein